MPSELQELQKHIDNRPQVRHTPATEGPLKGLCQFCREPVIADTLVTTNGHIVTQLAACQPCGSRWKGLNDERGMPVTLEPLPPKYRRKEPLPAAAERTVAPRGAVPKVAAPARPPTAPKPPKATKEESVEDIEASMAAFLESLG